MTTTTQTETKAKQGTNEFRDHMEAIKDDVADLKHDAVDAARTVGTGIQHQAEQMADLAKSGADKAGEFHESMNKTISKHPTAAVLLALGAGLMVGRIINGR